MAKKNTAEAAKIKVTLVKSTIGSTPYQKSVVESLGLHKLNSFRIHDNNACIQGMINKVSHLVKVENC